MVRDDDIETKVVRFLAPKRNKAFNDKGEPLFRGSFIKFICQNKNEGIYVYQTKMPMQ